MAVSTGAGVLIRPARATDAAALARLSGQFGYPTETKAMAKRLALVLGRSDQQVLVAEDGAGDVAGWVHIAERVLLQADRLAEVEGLVVEQARRRRGIGRHLMMAAEEWARGAGCRRISLRTNVVRSSALEFYQSLGYHLTKTQCTLQKEW